MTQTVEEIIDVDRRLRMLMSSSAETDIRRARLEEAPISINVALAVVAICERTPAVDSQNLTKECDVLTAFYRDTATPVEEGKSLRKVERALVGRHQRLPAYALSECLTEGLGCCEAVAGNPGEV